MHLRCPGCPRNYDGNKKEVENTSAELIAKSEHKLVCSLMTIDVINIMGVKFNNKRITVRKRSALLCNGMSLFPFLKNMKFLKS